MTTSTPPRKRTPSDVIPPASVEAIALQVPSLALMPSEDFDPSMPVWHRPVARQPTHSGQSACNPLNKRFFNQDCGAVDCANRGVVSGYCQRVDACRAVHAKARQLCVQFVERNVPRTCFESQVVALTAPVPFGLDGGLDQQSYCCSASKGDSRRSAPSGAPLKGCVCRSAAAYKLNSIQDEIKARVEALAEMIEPISIPDVGYQFTLCDADARIDFAHGADFRSVAQAQAPVQGLRATAAAGSESSRRADRWSVSWDTPSGKGECVLALTIATRGYPANTRRGWRAGRCLLHRSVCRTPLRSLPATLPSLHRQGLKHVSLVLELVRERAAANTRSSRRIRLSPCAPTAMTALE